MGSTVGTRMVTGSVEGTTSLIKINLEFTPRRVELQNIDDDCFLVWVHEMGLDSGMKTLSAGTTAFIAADGVIPVEETRFDEDLDPGRGFTIGADSDINASAETIVWAAFE